MKNPVYIVGAKRTAVGAFLGSLSSIPAPQLGAIALKAALAQANVSGEFIDELIFGNVVSSNVGQAPASQVAYYAGLPHSVPCTLVNKVCASGSKSIMYGAMSIELGINNLVAAGGMENMSQIPHYIPNSRLGTKYGNINMIDGIMRDGLQDPFNNDLMGVCGELCAEKYAISREAQDEYAIRSYNLAIESVKNGVFKNEIAPVDKIASLKPAFKKDGTITAANASKLNDGGSAVILASEEAVKKHNLKPLAKIIGYADAALESQWFTIAPSVAMPKAAKNAGLTLDQIDLFEINEAFAAVALVNQSLMNLPLDKVNVMGGAIALGHPLGSSGARILVSLITGLALKNKKYGMIGICNGGGGASSIVIERL